MKKLGIIILLISLNLCQGQESQNFDDKRFQNHGFFSPGSGLSNLEPLIFEAYFSNVFATHFKSVEKLSVLFTPSITIRMKNEYSLPVINPSYRALGEIRYLINQNNNHQNVIGLTIGHHSNGQSDLFYDWNDRVINYASGNFMTNFIRITKYTFSKPIFFFNKLNLRNSVAIECHSKIGRSGIFNKYYNDIRFYLSQDFLIPASSKNPEIKFQINFMSYLEHFGKNKYINGKFTTIDLMLSFKPVKKSDFAFFTQYYNGEDYYNIYFTRRINVFRFGLLAYPRKQ